MPADAYFRWVSFRKEGSATALGAPRLVVGPTRMMVRARRTSLAAAVSLCVLSGWLGAISVVDGFSFLPPRRLARTITLSAAEAATKVSSGLCVHSFAVRVGRLPGCVTRGRFVICSLISLTTDLFFENDDVRHIVVTWWCSVGHLAPDPHAACFVPTLAPLQDGIAPSRL